MAERLLRNFLNKHIHSTRNTFLVDVVRNKAIDINSDPSL